MLDGKIMWRPLNQIKVTNTHWHIQNKDNSSLTSWSRFVHRRTMIILARLTSRWCQLSRLVWPRLMIESWTTLVQLSFLNPLPLSFSFWCRLKISTMLFLTFPGPYSTEGGQEEENLFSSSWQTVFRKIMSSFLPPVWSRREWKSFHWELAASLEDFSCNRWRPVLRMCSRPGSGNWALYLAP